MQPSTSSSYNFCLAGRADENCIPENSVVVLHPETDLCLQWADPMYYCHKYVI